MTMLITVDGVEYGLDQIAATIGFAKRIAAMELSGCDDDKLGECESLDVVDTVIEQARAVVAGFRAEQPKVTKVCPCCGSDNVWKDATAQWCVETQQWELSCVHDHESCEDCGASGNDMSLNAEATS